MGQKRTHMMLRVATYVAPSRVSGMGLFAAHRIRRGTRIWEFTEGVDWRLTRAQLASFPEPFRSRLLHYAYLDDVDHFVLCGDNAKFMNHHESPNCSDADGRYTVSARTIDKGEELTCDYREFDLEARQNGLAFG